MSWSFDLCGRKKHVLAAVAKFKQSPESGPQQSVDRARKSINDLLSTWNDEQQVRVKASGHCYASGDTVIESNTAITVEHLGSVSYSGPTLVDAVRE